ncbi:MAG: tRNA lysidine(34) synthetase TilS [Rhodocyclales bacterium GWA2_65_19]|nr:MAG: tRNA lysidine(34) synthetase TilS [Rhodocyclales bacterium GWA2_65_19]
MTDAHHHLTEKVAALCAPLLPARSTILTGLSGGMDSVALLHLLHQLAPRFGWRLSALHVHHGISPNADAWADFCAVLCARYGIPLHIEHVDIAPLRGEHGIEAAARKLRHAAFAAQACDFVALAHHADDQAETLLLQLLRGAGVRGAAGMPVCARTVPGVPVTVRPLLNIARGELLDYARRHELRWIEDESNADDSYPRNFLRHRMLPLLEQRFPAWRDTLTRSARHFAEAGEMLDELARQDGAQAVCDGVLEVDALRGLTPPRAKNLLRHFLHAGGAPMPQSAQLDQMLEQLLAARPDAAVCVAFGGWQMRRYRGGAHVFPALGGFDRSLVLPWNGEAELDWPALNAYLTFARAQHPQGAGISLAKLQHAPVTLRLRRGGETLRPHPHAATRTLKHLLQEHGVPPWQRERLPLLYCGDELVCVTGVAVAAGYQPEPGEEGLLLGMNIGADAAKAM